MLQVIRARDLFRAKPAHAMPANPLSRQAGWGAEQTFLPGDIGIGAWNFDNALAPNTSLLFTAGRSNLAKLYLPGPMQITNIHMVMTAVGVTLTAGQCFAFVYDSAFNLVGCTADQSATWVGATGMLTMPLAVNPLIPGPPFLVDTPYCYVGAFYNGTTAPTFRSAAPAAGVNGIAAAINARALLGDAGLTTTPPAKLGNLAVNNALFWVGLS